MKKQILFFLVVFISAFSIQLKGQEWGELEQFLHETPGELDRFGYSVQIKGEYAVIGCPGFDSHRGRVFIYRFVNQEWVEYQILNPGDLVEWDGFGIGVALDGNYLVVGVSGEDEDENNEMPLDGAGAAYIYKLQGDFWVEHQRIVASDREESGGFGEVVSINGDYIAVGVPREQEDENGLNPLLWAGAAYIFKKEGDFWSEQQKVVSPDRSVADQFGSKIVIGDGNVFISSTFEDEDENGLNSLGAAGAVYVYSIQDETWQFSQKLVSSDRQVAAHFGSDLACQNDILVIGCENHNQVGAAFIFEPEANTWSQQGILVPSDGANNDAFGISVSISNNVIVVGSYYEDEDINQENSIPAAGAAYIYEYDDEWSEVQKMVASDRSQDLQFGSDVSIYEETILIGAIGYDEESINMVGAAYIFNTCATLIIDEVPDASTACEGESISLFASSNLGDINWYESSADSEPIFIGNEFNSSELEAGTSSFWIEAVNENCVTPRVEIEIEVLPQPDLIVDETELSVCEGNAAMFSASTSSENEIFWYESEDAQTFVSSGNTLLINGLEQSVTYWAQAENEDSGCVSDRIAITAEVVPIPNAPSAESPQIISVQDATLENLMVDLESENYTWYADEMLTIELPENTTIENGATYYITQTIDGCESLPTAILVELILNTSEKLLKGLSYYPNPFSSELCIHSANQTITEISVFNLLGELVHHDANPLHRSIKVNLQNEPAGIYFISLKIGRHTEQFRAIKR